MPQSRTTRSSQSPTSPQTFFRNLKDKPKNPNKKDTSPLTFFRNLKDKPVKRKAPQQAQQQAHQVSPKKETSIERRMKIIEKNMKEIDEKVKRINGTGYHTLSFLDGNRQGTKVLLRKKQ